MSRIKAEGGTGAAATSGDRRKSVRRDTLTPMPQHSSVHSHGPNRGARILLAILAAVAIGVPAAAQEPEVQKDVPYVPTPPDVVERMLKLGKAKKGDIHYDLGCGDGRIVITAVQKFGAERGTGYDIDPERIKEANENAENAGVKDKVKFILGNLFEADFRDATLVTLYLLPEVNMRLRPKLLKDLKVGSRIVSHQFDMGDWGADDQIQIEWRTVYVWTVTQEAKAKYAGN